jgi:hypothetical protein
VSPGRLDRVQVATSRRTVVLPWASRDELLEQMRHLETMTPVVDAFEAVGASVPVRLTLEQKARLVDVVRVRVVRSFSSSARIKLFIGVLLRWS